MNRGSRRATRPDASRRKAADVKARPGVAKQKGVRGGRGAAVPKLTGKVVKTFMDDSAIPRPGGRAVSQTVRRRPPKETS